MSEIISEQNKKNKLNKESIIKYLKIIGMKLGKKGIHIGFGILEICIIFILFCIFINWSNDSLIITEDTYTNINIPTSFNGYTILQISDFNNKKELSKELIKNTKNINPDIVVITGDYINSDRSTEYNVDYSYFEEISKQYPIYFVTGEQEQDSIYYDKVKRMLKDIGVYVLENETIELTNGSDKISLMGINDSSFFFENLGAFDETIRKNKTNEFTILLSHRPELIDIYTQNKIDLVITGHALGGQFNIPFVGPFYSSNQGFYPDYTSGFYKQEDTSIYVSRGIGNTFIPIRLFNRPEINVITLKK